MTEFFVNLWEWIKQNSGQILALLTPANLILLIGAVVTLFKQKKTIMSNTVSSAELSKTLAQNNGLKTQVDELSKQTADLKVSVGDIADVNVQSTVKLNSILDVQQLAYNASGLAKETREKIGNVIADGKFSETKNRRAVNEELSALRAQVKELLTTAEASEKKVKKLTGSEVKDKPGVGVRYD